MLRRRRPNEERAIELIVDASVREGWRLAHEVRDAELSRVLRIGIERDPGGMEPWEPPAPPSSSPSRDVVAERIAMLAEGDITSGDGEPEP